MSKSKKFYTVSFIMLGIISYSIYTVINARQNTIKNVQSAKSAIENPIGLDDLNVRQTELLLSVQDENFYEHSGTDLLSGKITTLSQALVKILYFDNFKPGIINKYRQSLIAAFAFDDLVSKDEQLFLFLNLAYLGHYEGEAVIGFNNASRVYYQKDFNEISENEYLSLLVMLSSPNGLNVIQQNELNRKAVIQLKEDLSI